MENLIDSCSREWLCPLIQFTFAAVENSRCRQVRNAIPWKSWQTANIGEVLVDIHTVVSRFHDDMGYLYL